MILGIVGHEGAKFDDWHQWKARVAIRDLLDELAPELVVSGACHLGGVDVWAIEEARYHGIPTREFPPASRKWDGGYKQRNLQIAEASDLVVSIVVKELPPTYTGMVFPYCYHCKTDSHIKSGGCWTVFQAKKMGKQGRVIEL